jgi:L-iditol 2-dehydrogenase
MAGREGTRRTGGEYGARIVRAAFMHDVGVVKIEDSETPKLDPEGGLVEVDACGICGTDARTFFNGDPRAPAPWILGHEPVGVLTEAGPEAVLPPGVEVGGRVFVGSILTCGTCRWCLDGFQNMCERHELYGYTPYPGAFADVAAVPSIATKNMIPLPPELPSDLATVADPFACALNGVEVLNPGYGDVVVIIGAGPIGCMQSVLCRDRGAARVYMIEVSRPRLDLAMEVVGDFVDDAWVAEDDNGTQGVLDRTNGAGAERVVVAAPSKEAQAAALVMAGRRARVVYFAGLPKDDPISPFDANQLHYKELAVLGSYGATHRQYRITMGYLDTRRKDLEGIVTHRFPLERIDEGFDAIKTGSALKVVIEP